MFGKITFSVCFRTQPLAEHRPRPIQKGAGRSPNGQRRCVGTVPYADRRLLPTVRVLLSAGKVISAITAASPAAAAAARFAA